MRKVEEFQETQKLMNEYNGFDTKIPELEKQIEANKEKADRRIAKLEEAKQPNEQDEEFNLDRNEIIKQCEEQINKEKEELAEKNKPLSDELEEAKDSKKYFRTDTHFKTITMEIEAMKKEVAKGEIELKKKDIELQEFYQEEQHENPLKWQKIYKEQDELRKDINALNAKIEEYSKFKEELNSINLTPEEYKEMFRREEERIAKENVIRKHDEMLKNSGLAKGANQEKRDANGRPITDGRTATTGRYEKQEKPVGFKTNEKKDSDGRPITDGRTATTGRYEQESDKIRVEFNAKEQSYKLFKGENELPEYEMLLDEFVGEDYEKFTQNFLQEYSNGNRKLEEIDYRLAYFLKQNDKVMYKNYVEAIKNNNKDIAFDLKYNMKGIYGSQYKTIELAEDLMKSANDQEELVGAKVEKNRWTKFLEKHDRIRHSIFNIRARARYLLNPPIDGEYKEETVNNDDKNEKPKAQNQVKQKEIDKNSEKIMNETTADIAKDIDEMFDTNKDEEHENFVTRNKVDLSYEEQEKNSQKYNEKNNDKETNGFLSEIITGIDTNNDDEHRMEEDDLTR